MFPVTQGCRGSCDAWLGSPASWNLGRVPRQDCGGSWESGPQGECQIQQKLRGRGEGGEGRAQGFGHVGLREVKGHLSGSGLAVGQPTGREAVQTSVQRAVRAWP